VNEEEKYTIKDKIEALNLLLNKAVKIAFEVEERIPYYMNARTYAHKLRVMIENAAILSKNILSEMKENL